MLAVLEELQQRECATPHEELLPLLHTVYLVPHEPSSWWACVRFFLMRYSNAKLPTSSTSSCGRNGHTATHTIEDTYSRGSFPGSGLHGLWGRSRESDPPVPCGLRLPCCFEIMRHESARDRSYAALKNSSYFLSVRCTESLARVVETR